MDSEKQANRRSRRSTTLAVFCGTMFLFLIAGFGYIAWTNCEKIAYMKAKVAILEGEVKEEESTAVKTDSDEQTDLITMENTNEQNEDLVYRQDEGVLPMTEDEEGDDEPAVHLRTKRKAGVKPKRSRKKKPRSPKLRTSSFRLEIAKNHKQNAAGNGVDIQAPNTNASHRGWDVNFFRFDYGDKHLAQIKKGGNIEVLHTGNYWLSVTVGFGIAACADSNCHATKLETMAYSIETWSYAEKGMAPVLNCRQPMTNNPNAIMTCHSSKVLHLKAEDSFNLRIGGKAPAFTLVKTQPELTHLDLIFLGETKS